MRILLSVATAIAILGLGLLVLLTPFWMHFALGAADSTAPGGPSGAAQASDRTVVDLLAFGGFDFAAPDGTPMYTDAERLHMLNVRTVLYLFLAVAGASIVHVAVILARRPAAADWRAVARGGAGLTGVIVALGVFALVAFNFAFEMFHRIFFFGGGWAFAADSNLIRLYPLPFWQLSSGALGVLAALGGLVTWLFARRRAAGRAA